MATTTRDTALRFWQALESGGAMRRPEGAPWCFSAGPNPYRLLLIGGRAAVGYGLETHDDALAGQLARILTVATDCGAEVDIVADDDMSVQAAVRTLEGRDLRRYNAVVLVLDALDACRPEARAPQQLRPLLQWIEQDAGGSAALILAFAPPLPIELSGIKARPPHPRRMEELYLELRRASMASRRSTTLVLPPPEQGDAGGAYEQWARPIVQALVPRLPRWDEPHGGQAPVDIEGRQRAVDRVGLCDPGIQREFEQIVEFARLAYGTKHASLAVFYEGEVRFSVARGFEAAPVPEERTVSAYAAASLSGLLVGDAQRHPQLGSREAVQTGRVRFYAGYRVESPDGHAVAVLCVSDPAPRDADDTDLVMLRSYAMAAQRRLWSLCARRAVAR